jgi:hypothetical protein
MYRLTAWPRSSAPAVCWIICQHHHDPRRDSPRQQQDDERERTQHLDRLEAGDHAPAIGAIREHAAEQGERPLRRIEHERVEADHEGRRMEVEQEPWLRDLLRPESEVR